MEHEEEEVKGSLRNGSEEG